MLKNVLLATACVAGLSFAGPLTAAFAAETIALSADEQAALDAQILAVENLIILHQDNPDDLQAAIESLVVNSTDAALTANAVLIVFDNSKNPTIQQILSNNSALVDAGGQGLGAAIAVIGVNNPELATQISAIVTASGSAAMTAAVESGSNSRTASLSQQRQQQENNGNEGQNDSTPEKTLSPSEG